ncbi:cation:proton antiporter subunit C [Kocuria rhizophila]|uniref:sodium:proton antiporter n=1 Tax=Kocuria TaxID=57493 RepID=UPI00214F979C|nr:cation:proton antiporter subunit C [Kocuria rhizophila]MCR4526376.1 cation:proton antiporter subunit C [Kocuria rhizophila]WIW68178.1 cation:proton antiporter subunit C [Kocuria sp. ChxB]
MSVLAIGIGLLVGGGVFMILRRGLMRIIVGFILLSNGVNLMIMAAGGIDRRETAIGSELDPAQVSDPLPQAFVLTAIVIAFAITMLLLVLSITGEGDDDTHIKLAGREMETPHLIDAAEVEQHPRRREPGGPEPTHPHPYLDWADDLDTFGVRGKETR